MPIRPAGEIARDKPCITIPGVTTVREMTHLMKERHTSAALVVENGVLVGICTERDVVIKVVADDRDPARTTVAEVMTREPQTLAPEKPFAHALHLMYEGGFRHVPVVDESGHPLGLLAARDALDLDALEFEHDLVRREEITAIL